MSESFVTHVNIVNKVCSCCRNEKLQEMFETYILPPDRYFTKSYCKECEGKSRCHTCHQIQLNDRFYTSKGRIDKYKCKQCYKSDFKRIMREVSLF